MRSNLVRQVMPDVVEITLGSQETIHSTRSTWNSSQQVPDEVRQAGPAAVEMYREFRARQAGADAALNIQESIEISCPSAAA